MKSVGARRDDDNDDDRKRAEIMMIDSWVM
jgi:hypothetical protein